MAPAKNILLMIADDLGRDQLGCYGCEAIQTSNLDSFAASGVMFDMAFTSTASCSGSRTVIYTGLHTHENGSYGLVGEKNFFRTADNVETAPALFNSLDYKTGIIGKVHVGPPSVYPWQLREEHESRDVAKVADHAHKFFEEAGKENKPFFLTIGYADPHRLLATRGGFGNVEGNYDSRLLDHRYSPDEVEIPSFLNDLPEVRQELAEYYRSIQRLDQGVGMVLRSLEKLGLADDTLVLFLSDNGPPFINSKTTLYDAGVRLPFLLRVPGRTEKNILNPNLISYIDILPTLLDWAGQPHRNFSKDAAGPRRGRSILPIINSTDTVPGWDRVFGSHTFHEITNYWPTRYMRTRRYKYHRNVCWKLDFPFAMDLYASLSFEGMRNSDTGMNARSKGTKEVMVGHRSLKDYIRRPPEELYDLDADPSEIRNLAQNFASRQTLLSMRKELERWQEETGDLWLWRDGVSVARFRTFDGYIREGLKIPDRFDFDVEKPGNEEIAAFKL